MERLQPGEARAAGAMLHCCCRADVRRCRNASEDTVPFGTAVSCDRAALCRHGRAADWLLSYAAERERSLSPPARLAGREP